MDCSNHEENIGASIEDKSATFFMVQLPSLDALKQSHDRSSDVDFMVQDAIEELVNQHIGEHSIIRMRDKLGVQIHKHMPKAHGRTCIMNFAVALDKGIVLKSAHSHTQLQWVDRPCIGVLESCADVNLAERIARTNEALDSMASMGHQLRAPLNIAYYSAATDGSTVDRMSNWRKERALKTALLNQEMELEFVPIYGASTDTLAGFRASFAPIIKYDGAEIRFKHSDIYEISNRLGLSEACNFLALKTALNQSRAWQALVPGNDTEITIPLDADVLMHAQQSILEMLKTYGDVASKLTIALNIDKESVAAKHFDHLNATICDLHQITGVRFAITEFGMSNLNLEMAQKIDVQVIFLASQWPNKTTSHTFNDPILSSLIELLHSFRTEVVATNIGTKVQLTNLKNARIDWYESSIQTQSALSENEALSLIDQQQTAISSTVINAQFRFRHAN